MARRLPGFLLWETTRPRPFFAFECTLVTLPRRQRAARRACVAAGSFNPLSFGTTHAPKALTVRIAFGVELEAQEAASAAWNTYAAPVPRRTSGAPPTAVAPSAERAPANSSSLA